MILKASLLIPLGVTWGLFWCPCGVYKAPELLKNCMWAPLTPNCAPRNQQQPSTPLLAPPSRSRGPREASKAPQETSFGLSPDDFESKIKEKNEARDIARAFSRRVCGCRTECVSFRSCSCVSVSAYSSSPTPSSSPALSL